MYIAKLEIYTRFHTQYLINNNLTLIRYMDRKHPFYAFS